MNLVVISAVVLFFILITALYVAAEFAAVTTRRPRLAQLAEDGNAGAAAMLHIVQHPERLDTFVAACQIGITVSTLLLGYYGQAQILDFLEPYITQLGEGARFIVQSAAATIILLVLTILQVILGELLPKNLAVQFPERIAVLTLPPMQWSMFVYRPFIWFFNGSGRLLLRWMGATDVSEHTHIHTPDEIRMLVEESSAGGVLDAGERQLLVNTLELRDMTVRKVMIPRNRMVVASVDQDYRTLLHLLATSPYSRLPLYEETVDMIVGIVHLKDLLDLYRLEQMDGGASVDLNVRSVMHAVLYVPDSADVDQVMDVMQTQRQNLAIVVDEYGGTAGMITFEDLVEEIIGEFHDEFDVEAPAIELRGNQRLRVRGDVLIDDLNELLGIQLPATAVATIGGLVVAELGRVPNTGDLVRIDSLEIRVDRVVNHGVAAVSFIIDPELAASIQAEL